MLFNVVVLLNILLKQYVLSSYFSIPLYFVQLYFQKSNKNDIMEY